MEERFVDGVSYKILALENIRPYVLSICKQEWTERDFVVYGEDLDQSNWNLENVLLSDISVNESLLKQEEFQKDLKPRIDTQRKLFYAQTPIPPLILRGKDFLIFDGYARYHLLRELGVEKCLAYVGR